MVIGCRVYKSGSWRGSCSDFGWLLVVGFIRADLGGALVRILDGYWL